MDSFLGRVQDFLAAASPAAILVTAFLSGIIETVFPPFPSEGVLLTTSFAGARHGVPAWQLVAVSALGSFLSLYGLFLLGRGPLREPVRRRLERWIGRAEKVVRRFFDRWGYGAVLVSRFLPAIRGPLTFLAGVYHLKKLPTAFALLTGCIIWNGLVVLLGFKTGRLWDGSTRGLPAAGLLLAGCTILLWSLGAVLYRLLVRPK